MCATSSGVSRTTESRHACQFLGSLNRLEPTAIGESCGSQASARVDVPTAHPFFCSADQGVCTFFLWKSLICARQTIDRDLESQRHEKVNAGKCARRTTHRGLASVIPDKKEKSCNH